MLVELHFEIKVAVLCTILIYRQIVRISDSYSVHGTAADSLKYDRTLVRLRNVVNYLNTQMPPNA